jgi:hypothetical protein
MRQIDTCQFFKASGVDFRQFLDKSWTDVSSSFLANHKQGTIYDTK